MATIYDIAELSKTSAATVSYVLNGRGDERRISKATQERVLSVAERLNYHPNITARQLKAPGHSSIRIAALWPEFYFEQPLLSAMRAIRDLVAVSTYGIEVSVHFFTPNRLSESWSKFSSTSYNGIVLAGASMDDLSLVASCCCSVPMVLINRSMDGIPSVSIDHTAAGRLACELAYKYGGNSVCSIWDTRFHVATNLRRTAFNQRSRELGLNFLDDQFTCEGSSEAGYELGISLVRKGLLKKLIYCNNESIAMGVLTALNESGLAVGRDVLLLTASNGPDSFCRYASPSMSSIDLRMQEVFSAALRLCLNIINRNETGENAITIQPRCILRDSMPEFPGEHL